MAGKIIMWVVAFGCGILFFGIGVYARRLKKPMWFWSGTEVDPAEITDVERYNRANCTMWQVYSVWFFGAGVAEIWSSLLSFVLIMLGSTLGSIILFIWYNRIFHKYTKRTLD